MCLFVHANAWAPGDWGYVRSEVEAERSLRATAERSHLLRPHACAGALPHVADAPARARSRRRPGKPVPLSRSRRWLAVLGAVGQPRDGNPAACYAHVRSSPPELTVIRGPLRRRGGGREDPRGRPAREPRGTPVQGR